MKKYFLTTIIFLMLPKIFFALYEEELLFIEIPTVSIATIKEMDIKETPAIVSVITEEEIRNSGARDLIDVLRLVPGFDVGVDMMNVVGIGFRGNWAQEGKVSLLLDDQEFSDILWANLAFGNHFPVDQIKKNRNNPWSWVCVIRRLCRIGCNKYYHKKC
ncbi:MAG: TonB-dependent receptor plug domain-containing protein [Endomicrobiia bacterium]